MKKQFFIALIIGLALVAAYFATSVSSHKGQSINITPKTGSDTKIIDAQQVKPMKTILADGQTLSKLDEKSLLTEKEVFDLWLVVQNQLKVGAIELSLEKKLIKLLRQQPNKQIYQDIVKLLRSQDADLNSRRQEYLLSLLAAINTSESVEVFLSELENISVSESNAIYTVKKSMQRLSRTSQYSKLFEESFINMSSDNLFISDVAQSIAKNAQAENLDFIISQIDANDKKSEVALQSLEYLKNEKLVPQLQTLIQTRTPDSSVTQASLQSLAGMGQYESAVALIQWSATIPSSSQMVVETLFTTAGNRSPSTYRAIEKELNRTQFVSSEVKQAIQSVYANRSQ